MHIVIEGQNSLTADPDNAEVKVELSLTSDTYRKSSPDAPELVATTTLTNADVLTVELRGENDSGTILENDFRMQHFTFHDLTTGSEVINRNPFPGTCEPRDVLYPYSVVELQPSKSIVTKQMLDNMSPLSDPVGQLEVGHEYRITLKPQTVWCFAGSKEELFRGKSSVPVGDLPEEKMVRLTLDSADALRLKVEA
jgi:hypothetical protein